MSIHYAFGPMESMAGQLDSLNARSVSVAEALSAEMTAMANFWDGTSHAAAMTYANNVTTQLRAVNEEIARFNGLAHESIADMQMTEAANASAWL